VGEKPNKMVIKGSLNFQASSPEGRVEILQRGIIGNGVGDVRKEIPDKYKPMG